MACPDFKGSIAPYLILHGTYLPRGNLSKSASVTIRDKRKAGKPHKDQGRSILKKLWFSTDASSAQLPERNGPPRFKIDIMNALVQGKGAAEMALTNVPKALRVV